MRPSKVTGASSWSIASGDGRCRALAGDGDGQVGVIGPQFDTRPDERVHALAGHKARNRRDERAVGRETEASPGGGLLGGGLRPEAFDVDTGRHDRARRQRSGRSLALGSRIAAGCDHSAEPASTRLSKRRVPGTRPGIVTSAPCRTTP